MSGSSLNSKEGRRLVAMAGTNVRHISDVDMYALIAFLRSPEPVHRDIPSPMDQPNFLALLLSGVNAVPEQPLITEPMDTSSAT